MVEKLTDALSMFWQSLDEREKMIALTVAAAFATVVWMSAQAERERAREQRIVDRIRGEQAHA